MNFAYPGPERLSPRAQTTGSPSVNIRVCMENRKINKEGEMLPCVVFLSFCKGLAPLERFLVFYPDTTVYTKKVLNLDGRTNYNNNNNNSI